MSVEYKILTVNQAKRGPRMVGKGEIDFEVLPFVLSGQGTDGLDQSEIVAEFRTNSIEYLHLLKGIDWLLTQKMDVLNLSLGLTLGPTPFDPDEPLQLATRFASEHGVPVIVAAGNDGPNVDTLQPLARAPWVISVGATDSQGRLLDSSSRGSPDGPKPTLVSLGEDEAQDHSFDPGTSFAAPRISGIAAWLLKCFQFILRSLTDWQRGKPLMSDIVQVPVVGIADTGTNSGSRVPSVLRVGEKGVRISYREHEQRWFEGMVNALRPLDPPCEVVLNPNIIRRALTLMARRLPNYSPFEVGAGFVSFDEARSFLLSFTPSRFIQLMCPDVINQIPEETLQGWDNTFGPLFDTTMLWVLQDLFLAGVRIDMAKVI